MAEHDSRRVIRTWWKDQLSRLESVDIKVMSGECASALRNDPEFCAAFVDAFLEKAVYEIGIGTLSADRAYLRKGDQATPVASLIAEVDAEIQQDTLTRSVRWAAWKEYDPAAGLHIPLLQMTKEQCFRAATYREDRAKTDMQDGLWLRLIAGKLRKGDIVQDVLSGEDLDELRKVAERQKRKTSLPVVTRKAA